MRYTLLYDGDCGICTFMADRVNKWDKKKQFRVLPSWDISETDINLPVSINPQKTVIVYTHYENIFYTEGVAIFLILSKFNIIFRIIYGFVNNPIIAPIINFLYRIIANKRAYISRSLGLNRCKVKAIKS